MTVSVLDSNMNYREAGSGTNIVLLHGNPLPSYVWRNVLPVLGQHAHCLAPDLIGMGESGRPAIAYRFDDHARYLEAWMRALNLKDVVLIGYDWGGALAMDYAARHPDNVRGLAVFETFLRPMHWSDWPAQGATLFKNLRAAGSGEKLVLDDNAFLARSIENGVKSGLAIADHDYYVRSYATRQSRVPMLQWPREIPIDGEPTDVAARIERYGDWLQQSATPKLLMTFTQPSVIMPTKTVTWAKQAIRALQVTDLPEAGHHAPEDRPAEISAALLSWLHRHALAVPKGSELQHPERLTARGLPTYGLLYGELSGGTTKPGVRGAGGSHASRHALATGKGVYVGESAGRAADHQAAGSHEAPRCAK